MRLKFWGTRGSIPKPGPTTLRYGGNTSCVEVRAPDGTLIVLDCGTGAHELGRALLGSGPEVVRGHLLITHTHWDHIQGFPFFAPLFEDRGEWDVYAPQGLGQQLEETLAGQMEFAYFPVTLKELRATVRYHDLVEGAFDIGLVRVVTRYLNHPCLTLGYRLETAGVSIVYATDHEPHGPPDPSGGTPIHPEDRRHIEFLQGADLVIHDCQYTLEEYPSRRTWGHSPAEYAVDVARAAGVRRLALFHHDPLRGDEALDSLLACCRERAAGAVQVFAAAEGQVVELAPRSVPTAQAPATARGHENGPRTVLVVEDEAEVLQLLVDVLTGAGFRVLTARDGDTAVRVARAERPDLVLLDWGLPDRDGLAVCRALRADADSRVSGIPVLMLTGRTEPGHAEAGFAAGVSDYLTKPFKVAHVLSRVHAWLIRSGTD